MDLMVYPPLCFNVHSSDMDLTDLWEVDHRLSLMMGKSPGGAITLIDPEAEPPAKMGLTTPKWFANPVYEGATPLVNEEEAIIRTPSYYFGCIDQLVSHGS